MRKIAASWPVADNIVAFTTTREAGVSIEQYQSFNTGLHVGDQPAAVQSNRDLLLDDMGISDAQWLEQVHGIQCIKAARDKSVIAADACWTDEANLACIVMTADCLPVAMSQGANIAVAHAGWRGLLAGGLESSLEHLDTADTDIWLGPAIGANAFEVGEEVRELFVCDNPTAATAFVAARQPNKWFADLYKLARIKLVDVGVDPQRIHGGEHCTFQQSEQFYSYRRDGSTGRMATVIYRAENS
ncbi:MAG: hypothetical protein OFPI_05270 [Osedax symbiont Rs2]|nr:MAG: hypothetical protein OFPI_05270 [Osedax symbiont Rs2]